ncbi:MAG: hypothetical protein HFJ03_08600 [Lachnospira sp.]|nr:hypothetical protein [Lachnospira sp.]
MLVCQLGLLLAGINRRKIFKEQQKAGVLRCSYGNGHIYMYAAKNENHFFYVLQFFYCPLLVLLDCCYAA